MKIKVAHVLSLLLSLSLLACTGGDVVSFGNGTPDQFLSDSPVQFIPYELKQNILTGSDMLALTDSSGAMNRLEDNALQQGALNETTGVRQLSFNVAALRTWYLIADEACDDSLSVQANVDRLFPNGFDDCKEMFNAIVGRPMNNFETEAFSEVRNISGLTTAEERLHACCVATLTSLATLIY